MYIPVASLAVNFVDNVNKIARYPNFHLFMTALGTEVSGIPVLVSIIFIAHPYHM